MSVKGMPKELTFSRSITYNTDNIIEDILEMANDESMTAEDVSLDLVIDWINDIVWEDFSKLYENTSLRIEDEYGRFIGDVG